MRVVSKKSLSAATELARREEEKLKTKTSEVGFTRTDEEMQRLIHELEVHQIELEMQNAELSHAREELETALGKYSDIYEFFPVGYFTVDRHGVISAKNLSGAGLLGVERSRLVGRSFGAFVTEEYRLTFTVFLNTVFTSQGKQMCEVALLNKGNLPLFVRIEAIATASGQECHFALIDISDRKRVEQKLEKNVSILNDTGKLAKVGGWELNIITGIQTWTDETYHIFEIDLTGIEPLLPDSFNFYVPASRPIIELAVQRAIKYGESYDLTLEIITAKGNHRWVHTVGNANQENGTTKSLSGAVQDITKRKLVEAALNNSEEQIRYAATAADIGMWHWNLVNNELTWSERCKGLFGYPPDYPLTYESFLQAIHEEDRQRVDETVQKTLQEKTEYSVEMRVVVTDGQVRWIMSKGRCFYDDPGKSTSMHGIAVDITERKRREEKIGQLNTKLAERAAELESANIELEAFNFTVSHDLRQPLNCIGSACQAVEMLSGDKLDEENKACLKIAIDGVMRMSNLIETLLKFSNSAHCIIRQEIVHLSIIARILVANLQMTEPERQVTFTIAEGLTANGDPELLYIVLENLIGNAWKYTARQSLAVIEIGSTENNGTKVFFVKDNGPGFSMADAEKLFIPFKRLPGTTEFIGHGIGLATVQRIIRRHGGKVWAEGVPGKGACFRFTLS